jgi:hypothetical protein
VISQANVVVVAVLALVTGVVSLVFQLAPRLKPDPRDRVGADVSIFALEPNVTLGSWIQRAFPVSDHERLEKKYPDRGAVGELLYVRTTVDGHKHRSVTLRYDVFDADKQELIPPESIDAPPLGALKLTSPNERSVQLVWVPDFTQETRDLIIRVQLWDGDGLLAVTDSPRIKRGRFAVVAARD